MTKALISYLKNNNIVLINLLLGLLFFLLGLNIPKAGIFLIVIILLLTSLLFFFKRKQIVSEFNKKFFFSIQFISIVSYTLGMFLFSSIWNIADFFKNAYHYLLIPPLFFGLGFLFSKTNQNKWFLFIILSYFFGTFFLGILNVGYSFSYFGFSITNTPRIYFSIWTDESLSCTGLSILLIPIFVFSITSFFSKQKRIDSAIVCLFCIIISIIFSAQFANRAFFIASFLAVSIIVTIILTTQNVSKRLRIIVFAIVFSLLFLLFLTYFLLLVGNSFVINIFLNIPLLNRFVTGGSDSERLQIYSNFFQIFYKYPAGGIYQQKALIISYYTHNVFLDVYCIGGIIPFLSFLSLNVLFIRDYCIRLRNDDGQLKIIFISLYFAIIALSLFEPTIHSNVYSFCMLFGIFGNAITSKQIKVKEDTSNCYLISI